MRMSNTEQIQIQMTIFLLEKLCLWRRSRFWKPIGVQGNNLHNAHAENHPPANRRHSGGLSTDLARNGWGSCRQIFKATD
jgi:hypothetical protein